MRVIDPHIAEHIRPELRPEEKLLWVGKPARFPITLLGWFNLLMLFVWLPFFVYFVYANGGFEEIEITGFLLWILPLVAVVYGFFAIRQAIQQVFGPSKDLYALTPERGIILRDFFRKRVTSLSPEVLKNAHRKGGEKVATLDFYPSRTVSSIFLAEHDLTAFRNIADAKAVEDLIHRTFSKKDRP